MSGPSSPRVARLAEQVFAPRFAYGEMAEASQVCGSGDGTALGTGYARMTNAEIPWTTRYDEVVLVLEGSLKIETDAQTLSAGPQDCIWLPAGTELVYRTASALVFYAIHPADWAERETGARP